MEGYCSPTGNYTCSCRRDSVCSRYIPADLQLRACGQWTPVSEERRFRPQMCHRWLLAVIMCLLPWQPVYSLPLEMTSTEGFPRTTSSPASSDFTSSSVPPSNIQVQAPLGGSLPPGFPIVQSMRDLETFPSYFSHRVAFSLHPPPPIPSADDFAIDTEEDSVSPHSRSKRGAHSANLLSVCDVRRNWGRRSWAIDILGQNVTVVESITTNNNQLVSQWFYETSCAPTQHSCKGVDHNRYVSRCMTRKSWVFAVVRQGNGDVGWNWVSIDTACNCGYKRRRDPIHDLFSGRDADDDDAAD